MASYVDRDKTMKITDDKLLKNGSLNALLAVFANAKPRNEGGFAIESSYRKSTGNYVHAELTKETYEYNNGLLSKYFDLPFVLSGTKHYVHIESELDKTEFFSAVYRRIIQKRFEEDVNDDLFEQKILLAFWGLRGSLDFKRKYYTVDIWRETQDEKFLDNLFQLITNLSDLRQLNLNFRELQEQYVNGKKRQTQFRIKLRYFYDVVGKELLKLNVFKYQTLELNKDKIGELGRESTSVMERILFYKEKVLGQESNSLDVNKLRQDLGFEYEETGKRNYSIVKFARSFLEDECVACKNSYTLAERTFKYRNSERYYLEVHHCISFSADNTCDQIDNLVKLCPACHRALTKNRADEEYQKGLIRNIFINAPQAKEFCLNFSDEDNVVQFVYDRLR